MTLSLHLLQLGLAWRCLAWARLAWACLAWSRLAWSRLAWARLRLISPHPSSVDLTGRHCFCDLVLQPRHSAPTHRLAGATDGMDASLAAAGSTSRLGAMLLRARPAEQASELANIETGCEVASW